MAPKIKKIDVRKLLAEGIEPMPQIRIGIDALKPEERLAVISPFLPAPLIEKLKAEGMECRPERQPDGSWITQFWRI